MLEILRPRPAPPLVAAAWCRGRPRRRRGFLSPKGPGSPAVFAGDPGPEGLSTCGNAAEAGGADHASSGVALAWQWRGVGARLFGLLAGPRLNRGRLLVGPVLPEPGRLPGQDGPRLKRPRLVVSGHRLPPRT